MRPPLSSRKNNRPERVTSAEIFVPLVRGEVIVCPFVSLPLEERLDVGRDCVPPGSDLVDHYRWLSDPFAIGIGCRKLPGRTFIRARDHIEVRSAITKPLWLN